VQCLDAILDTRVDHFYESARALCNLGMCQMNGMSYNTAAHYAAIHCQGQQTVGHAMQPAAIPPTPDILSFRHIVRKLPLISHFAESIALCNDRLKSSTDTK